uniref:Uncharacterized protein n=1 Tax=Onchocerca volvulus TaxID=6282 RepID=A0A8R1XX22_ONCVO
MKGDRWSMVSSAPLVQMMSEHISSSSPISTRLRVAINNNHQHSYLYRNTSTGTMFGIEQLTYLHNT